jgi:hypothetical protein
MQDATLLCLCPPGKTLKGEGEGPTVTVERWGVRFEGIIADLEPEREYSITRINE